MNQTLNGAASLGLIDSLYSIIEEDAYILDRIDQVPFIDTPLHISVLAGHVHFSLEIIRLKPSLAKKLNPKGYSPIHMALQNDQIEIVLRLVDVDQDLISIQGREGLSPLHIAALEGKDEVLAKFLVLCPKSINVLTVRKESALHIAVKNGKIGSLKILLEWTREACISSIINWSDEEGNNIMHLAAIGNQIEVDNQIEMVKLLLTYNVDIKSKNLKGFSAVDILRQNEFLGDKELEEKLDDEHNIIVKQLRLAKILLKWTLWFIKRLAITDHREIVDMSKEDRNAILVVSVLIATATYQAVLSPPDKEKIELIYMSYNCRYFTYILFKYFNTLAFVASMIEICLHLPSGIRYTLHLVLPLVNCYILLMLFWLSCYTGVLTTGAVIVFILTKIPALRQKISGDLNPKKKIKRLEDEERID
ncbi:ankyrin repeat-containing protein BDA1-like [Benincasa hispida]|uniref:ankyrin repeat-containing protein BDA1-like n=1 Tax=Benincasa hispida TaxID=102211 RepID=UPI0019016026|nr:ankyrin repeat-containing protein BDA1-like [Benincasa hispida]